MKKIDIHYRFVSAGVLRRANQRRKAAAQQYAPHRYHERKIDGELAALFGQRCFWEETVLELYDVRINFCLWIWLTGVLKVEYDGSHPFFRKHP